MLLIVLEHGSEFSFADRKGCRLQVRDEQVGIQDTNVADSEHGGSSAPPLDQEAGAAIN
jgi:hypothetical protein